MSAATARPRKKRQRSAEVGLLSVFVCEQVGAVDTM